MDFCEWSTERAKRSLSLLLSLRHLQRHCECQCRSKLRGRLRINFLWLKRAAGPSEPPLNFGSTPIACLALLSDFQQLNKQVETKKAFFIFLLCRTCSNLLAR